MKLKRLLLTGAAGGLGKVLRPKLSAYADIVRISDIADLGAAAPHEELDRCDLGDYAAVERLVKDVDMILHLGGISLDGPFEPILNANIRGAYNLYEASRIEGVKRILFASSNHVIGFHKQTDRLDDSAAMRPDGNYGVSKAFGELLSRFYFDRYGFETVCIRIGSSFPKALDRRMLSTWLSYDDLERLIACCIKTPKVDHTIVYASSDNQPSWWDNKNAAHLGWAPKDSSEQFRAEVMQAPALDPSDPAAIFQGGGFVKLGPFPTK